MIDATQTLSKTGLMQPHDTVLQQAELDLRNTDNRTFGLPLFYLKSTLQGNHMLLT